MIAQPTLNVDDESVDGKEPEGVDGVHDQLVAAAQREGEAASRQLPCLYRDRLKGRYLGLGCLPVKTRRNNLMWAYPRSLGPSYKALSKKTEAEVPYITLKKVTFGGAKQVTN